MFSPVTLEIWKMGHILWEAQQMLEKEPYSLPLDLKKKQKWTQYLSELKFEAVTITSSLFCTRTGIFLQPGDLSNLWSSFSVSVKSKHHINTEN